MSRLGIKAYDRVSACKEVVMQRFGNLLDHKRREDFGEGDHQEYVESGTRNIVLIGGATLLLIGGFIASLV